MLAHSCECGDHAWAALSKGCVALVSPESASTLEAFSWYPSVRAEKRAVYVETRIRGKSYRLHQEIVGKLDGYVIDHINGNGLDNRRPNLRHATVSANNQNRRVIAGGIPYKGVTNSDPRYKTRYRAQIQVAKKNVYLGRFATAVEAALAYDEAAKRYFGEFAVTNKQLGLL